ncbi:MAG: hypothetical protein JKY65_08575 [Planctomycetes bacterium]|nr:hypothetical protein [Planctomycetota bacterium]
MDELLRELGRDAAGGDSEARAAFAARLARLGGASSEFQFPREVPPLVEDYSDPVLYDPHRHGLDNWWGAKRETKRLFRASSHRRHRGRVRQALRGLRRDEWDDL